LRDKIDCAICSSLVRRRESDEDEPSDHVAANVNKSERKHAATHTWPLAEL